MSKEYDVREIQYIFDDLIVFSVQMCSEIPLEEANHLIEQERSFFYKRLRDAGFDLTGFNLGPYKLRDQSNTEEEKTMHQTAILVRAKDQQVPEEYKQKLLEAYPSGLGYAVAFEGKIETLFFDGTEYELKSAFDEIENVHKDKRVLYHFLKTDGDAGTRDQQPYVMIADEGNYILVVVTDGQFIGYSQGDSALSADFHMAHDYLQELVTEIYKEAGEDPEKMMKAFDGAMFRRSVLGVLQPTGVITLMCSDSNVAPLSFKNKHEHQIDYSFGWSSQSLGWAEVPPKEEKKGPSLDVAARMAALRKNKEEKKDETVGGKVATVPSVKYTEPEMWAIPANLAGRDKRRYIKRNFTTFPADWQTIKEMPVSQFRSDSSLRQHVKSFQQLKEAADAKAIAGAVVVTGESPPPIVSPEHKKEILEIVSKAKMIDPSHLNDLEDEHELASEFLPNGLRDLIRLPGSAMLQICSGKFRDFIYSLTLELLSIAVKHDPSLLEPSKEEEEKAEAEEAATAPPKEGMLAAIKKKVTS